MKNKLRILSLVGIFALTGCSFLVGPIFGDKINPPNDETTRVGDPLTYLGSSYYTDTENIYFDCYSHDESNPEVPAQIETCILEGLDSETFVALDQYFKDKDAVYYRNPNNRSSDYELVEGADPDTFEILNTVETAFSAKDKNNYYAKATAVDLDTYEQLDGSYAKDKNHVYGRVLFYGMNSKYVPIEGVDPDFFTVINHVYGADNKNKNVYFIKLFKVYELEGADPATLEVIATDQNFEGFISKDSTHVYHNQLAVSGADASSFREYADSPHFYLDNSAVYVFMGSSYARFDEVDSETFELLETELVWDMNEDYETRGDPRAIATFRAQDKNHSYEIKIYKLFELTGAYSFELIEIMR